MRTVALAAVIGLAATLVAIGVLALGGPGATALEWSAYDRWLRTREPAPVSPVPVIVVRDPASEARFGTGAWDRAVLARLITSLSRAGAAVVGVDVPLGQPSAPGRGGASSDALLSQAIALAENVVLPITLELIDGRAPAGPGDGAAPALSGHRSWPTLAATQDFPEARPVAGSLAGLAQYAKGIGHTLAPSDPDGVTRRVPLFVLDADRGATERAAPDHGRRPDRAPPRRAGAGQGSDRHPGESAQRRTDAVLAERDAGRLGRARHRPPLGPGGVALAGASMVAGCDRDRRPDPRLRHESLVVGGGGRRSAAPGDAAGGGGRGLHERARLESARLGVSHPPPRRRGRRDSRGPRPSGVVGRRPRGGPRGRAGRGRAIERG